MQCGSEVEQGFVQRDVVSRMTQRHAVPRPAQVSYFGVRSSLDSLAY